MNKYEEEREKVWNMLGIEIRSEELLNKEGKELEWTVRDKMKELVKDDNIKRINESRYVENIREVMCRFYFYVMIGLIKDNKLLVLFFK